MEKTLLNGVKLSNILFHLSCQKIFIILFFQKREFIDKHCNWWLTINIMERTSISSKRRELIKINLVNFYNKQTFKKLKTWFKNCMHPWSLLAWTAWFDSRTRPGSWGFHCQTPPALRTNIVVYNSQRDRRRIN